MIRPTLFALIPLIALSAAAAADDYPQYMGPQRDGVYREPNVLATFPAGGPKVLWRAPVAGGYAGPAVAAGKVFVTDFALKPGGAQPKDPFDRSRLAGTERVLCLDDATGNVLWKVEYDVAYTVSYASGPRCTPTVDVAAGRVYTLGAEGHLYCIDINTGKVAWHVKLDGPTPVWGFAGHPLIDGDRLVVLTSGEKALVTAFNKHTGDVVWTALKSKAPGPGYAPPMIFDIAGRRRMIVWHPNAIEALEPETGKPVWSHAYGPITNGVSIIPPFMAGDDTLLVTSAHEGLLALKVSPNDPPKELYRTVKKGRATNTIHGLMNPLAMSDGHVYAVSIAGELRCVDPRTGKIVWESTAPTTRDNGEVNWYTAFVTPWQPPGESRPRHVFIANEDGDLITARLTPEGYTELSRAHVLDPTNKDARRPVIWCHPAYANQSVYWRNDKELVRVSLAPGN